MAPRPVLGNVSPCLVYWRRKEFNVCSFSRNGSTAAASRACAQVFSSPLCPLFFSETLVIKKDPVRTQMRFEAQLTGQGLQRFYIIYSTVVDRLSSLVVRVPGYITEMYCDFCEVRTEFIYVM
jgi:hypothetical protein